MTQYLVRVDRYITRRPFNLPSQRPSYSESDPKIGIGSMSFSPDGLYLCSKNDKMPTVLWIWQVSTLKCIHMLLFRRPIKQAAWNPAHDHLIAVICSDENIHFAELTAENEGIEMIPVTVPYGKCGWRDSGFPVCTLNVCMCR